MADPSADEAAPPSRKEKRKALKKQKRKQTRQERAIKERQEEEARANDPQEQLHIKEREKEEAELAERARKEFEDRERLWLEAAAKRREEEEARRQELLEESRRREVQESKNELEDDDWEYVEEGPAEIIWGENEIIVKKKRVKVRKRSADQCPRKEEDDRPTSNPLPPQSAAFAAFQSGPPLSAQELLESVAQQTPNFGTEQDKAHCPFHLKTGACRFGTRCSRVHFYPDKANTLLIRNMYSGPGLAWELDEGLESTDEEVERCYEEFYEDAHTEFLKFGEIVNFKVCRNSSVHLRGNVYVHYKSIESAVLAFETMNGRYFAGKQIKCEFVSVTRWKIAICGEYMKSRFKTCSRGAACNFIHCFRNPGGEYDWADWDNPPPRYWMKKMSALFGPSDNAENHKNNGFEDSDHHENSSRKNVCTGKRLHLSSRHRERDDGDTESEGRSNTRESRHGTQRSKQGKSSKMRKRKQSDDDQEKPDGYTSKRLHLVTSGNVERDIGDSDSEDELNGPAGRCSSRKSKLGYSSKRKEKQSDDDWEKLEGRSSSIAEYGPLHFTTRATFRRSHSRQKESSGFENKNFEDRLRVHKGCRNATSSSRPMGNTHSYGNRSPETSYRYSERYDGHSSPDCDRDRYHTDEKSSRSASDFWTRHSCRHMPIDHGTERELLDRNGLACKNDLGDREVQENPERYTPLCEEPDVRNNSGEHESQGKSVSSGESQGDPKRSNVTGCQDILQKLSSRHSRYRKSSKGDASPGDSFCSRKNQLHLSHKKTCHRSTHEEDDGSRSCQNREEYGSACDSPNSEDAMALDFQKRKHTGRHRRKHEKQTRKYSHDEDDCEDLNSSDSQLREKESRRAPKIERQLVIHAVQDNRKVTVAMTFSSPDI